LAQDEIRTYVPSRTQARIDALTRVVQESFGPGHRVFLKVHETSEEITGVKVWIPCDADDIHGSYNTTLQKWVKQFAHFNIGTYGAMKDMWWRLREELQMAHEDWYPEDPFPGAPSWDEYIKARVFDQWYGQMLFIAEDYF
jgi:hypothetical protein